MELQHPRVTFWILISAVIFLTICQIITGIQLKKDIETLRGCHTTIIMPEKGSNKPPLIQEY